MRHEDYSVGWICALEETELPAAESMFDEPHPSLPQDREDENIYRLGRIRQHNVVIACISAGRYGIGAAAVVAIHMKRTFKWLRFGLLVGIGGAVPSDLHDIKLGDVVVSQPTTNDGGVIQYDLGKVLSDRSFKEKGHLNSPPTILLNAIGAIKGKHRRTVSDIPRYLEEMYERHSKMKDQFVYQGKDHDILYNASTADAVEHHKREQGPLIHYGLIASGNRVIASVEERKKLCMNRDILCFEMEAAGILNDFPCLVIRGISDYADSTKNDQWQPYAAAVAAAYTKELLEVIPSESINNKATLVGGLSNMALKPEAITKPLFTVPFLKDEEFIDRADVLMNMKDLSETTRRIALYGIGGIGKSQIAIEFCYLFLDESIGSHIIWIHCGSRARYAQDYRDAASIKKIPGYDDPKQNPVDLVHQWLNSEESGPWLLVLDNVDNLEILGEQNPQQSSRQKLSLPKGNRGTILLTTRDRRIGEQIFGRKNCVNVPYMTFHEAEKLLRSQVEETSIENAADLQVLFENLDYLPLAITQAAAFIHQNGDSIATYNGMIAKQEITIEEVFSEYLGDPKRDPESETSVIKTWIISFEQIKSQKPRAADLLCLMSMLDRQKIQEELLRNDEDRPIDFTTALGTLKAFSLINTEREENTYSMHRLVQMITKEWLRVQNQRKTWEQQAIRAVANAFPPGRYENWGKCELLLPHTVAVLGYPLDDNYAVEFATLLHNKAQLDETQGRYAVSEEGFSHALEIWKNAFGEDHQYALRSKSWLANVYSAQGRWDEAEQLEVELVKKQTEELGEDHLETLISMGNLAATYVRQRRWNEAEQLLTKAMEKQKKKLGEDHQETLISMANLAATYGHQKRWDGVEQLETKVIEKQKTKLGEGHPNTLYTMGNLAVTYMQQDRWNEAERLLRKVMEMRRSQLGEDHPDTLSAMSNLAWTLKRTGRGMEAIDLMRETVQKTYSSLGDSHIDTLRRLEFLEDWTHSSDENSEDGSAQKHELEMNIEY